MPGLLSVILNETTDADVKTPRSVATANTLVAQYEDQANTHVTRSVGTMQSMLQTLFAPSFLLCEIQSC